MTGQLQRRREVWGQGFYTLGFRVCRVRSHLYTRSDWSGCTPKRPSSRMGSMASSSLVTLPGAIFSTQCLSCSCATTAMARLSISVSRADA